MTNIAHSALVLGTTVLSLSILFFGGYVITFLSQKSDGDEGQKLLNYRISRTSLFERVTIAGTIAALYLILMLAFFIFMSWESAR
jgi:hypothetical protein